ncbi:MAG: hypothetical protein JSS53_02170 [Proteobacteria bacterium]|nr:hypothetical protein [Pseudomonadota bacterium]
MVTAQRRKEIRKYIDTSNLSEIAKLTAEELLVSLDSSFGGARAFGWACVSGNPETIRAVYQRLIACDINVSHELNELVMDHELSELKLARMGCRARYVLECLCANEKADASSMALVLNNLQSGEKDRLSSTQSNPEHISLVQTSVLHEVCRHHGLEELKVVLQFIGAKVRIAKTSLAMDYSGYSVLHLICYNIQKKLSVEALKLMLVLLDSKRDEAIQQLSTKVPYTKFAGYTPLHFLCQFGGDDELNLFLSFLNDKTFNIVEKLVDGKHSLLDLLALNTNKDLSVEGLSLVLNILYEQGESGKTLITNSVKKAKKIFDKRFNIHYQELTDRLFREGVLPVSLAKPNMSIEYLSTLLPDKTSTTSLPGYIPPIASQKLTGQSPQQRQDISLAPLEESLKPIEEISDILGGIKSSYQFFDKPNVQEILNKFTQLLKDHPTDQEKILLSRAEFNLYMADKVANATQKEYVLKSAQKDYNSILEINCYNQTAVDGLEKIARLLSSESSSASSYSPIYN